MDYRQLVRATAERYGLDPNLAEAVMAQESGGRPDARSPVGATGLMQLMPGTAKDLGVDPNDPAQNVEGGVRYLKQQVDKFGVAGGLAAYNAGPGRVMKVGGRFDALPNETRNYVPSVMNRAADIAEQRGGRVAQAQPQAPTLDVPTLIGGFEKAKAANDEEAVKEIGGLLKNKFDSALSAARQANDTEAVKEIEGMMGRYGVGATTAVAKPTSPAKPEKKTSFLQDVGLGAADALSFGFADEAYAAAASRLRGTKYEDELKTARETIDQAGPGKYLGMGASFLVPGIGVVRAANTATRLGRAAAGAATGATQGGLYGAGSAEGDLVDRATGALGGAATGAVLGGTVGALVPSTVKQEANAFKKRAGTAENARLDAEIALDMNDVFQREVRQVGQRIRPAQAIDANAFEARYINEARQALDKLPKDKVPNLEQLVFEIQNRRSTPSAVVEQLQQTDAGKAVVDALMKADRVRTLTGQQSSKGGMAGMLGRTAVDAAPAAASAATGLPIFLGRGVQEGLRNQIGGSVPRASVINRLLSDKQVDAARMVSQELGPSGATQSLQNLQQMAQRAQAQAQAQAAAQAQAQAAQAAQDQATRLQVLQQTRRPLSGAFQELLPGGRANTNLASGQAIDALRLLKRQGGPVGNAATEILASRPVSNESTFYGLQNALRGLQERGLVPGSSTPLGAATSGVRNPISYAEAVRTAGEAANLARSSAPSKELAQFATKIAGTKSPADKVKLLNERLSKADPAEASYLMNFVEPLTKFGSKTNPSQGALSAVTKEAATEFGNVVYHGGRTPISTPDLSLSGKVSGIKEEGRAFWVTPDAASAKKFAEMANGNVVSKFNIAPNNPLVVEVPIKDYASGAFGKLKIDSLNRARELGHDAVIFKQAGKGMKVLSDEIAVLDPSILKAIQQKK